MTEQDDPLERFQQEVSYRFGNVSLLREALTHSSSRPEEHRTQERLEFLGDAVASLVVAHMLYESSGDLDEGEMTVMKSNSVSRRSMALAGRRLNLEEYLWVERGLARSKRYPPSVIADAYEALVGAVFLDGGFGAAREFVLRTLGPELDAAKERRHPPNYKSVLQQLVQAEGRDAPVYRTIKNVGPDHDKRFLAAVELGGIESGSGWGKTKKDAEQKAAQAALDSLYPGRESQMPAT